MRFCCSKKNSPNSTSRRTSLIHDYSHITWPKIDSKIPIRFSYSFSTFCPSSNLQITHPAPAVAVLEETAIKPCSSSFCTAVVGQWTLTKTLLRKYIYQKTALVPRDCFSLSLALVPRGKWRNKPGGLFSKFTFAKVFSLSTARSAKHAPDHLRRVSPRPKFQTSCYFNQIIDDSHSISLAQLG